MNNKQGTLHVVYEVKGISAKNFKIFPKNLRCFPLKPEGTSTSTLPCFSILLRWSSAEPKIWSKIYPYIFQRSWPSTKACYTPNKTWDITCSLHKRISRSINVVYPRKEVSHFHNSSRSTCVLHVKGMRDSKKAFSTIKNIVSQIMSVLYLYFPWLRVLSWENNLQSIRLRFKSKISIYPYKPSRPLKWSIKLMLIVHYGCLTQKISSQSDSWKPINFTIQNTSAWLFITYVHMYYCK